MSSIDRKNTLAEKFTKTKRELRRFGLVITAPLLVIGCVLIWRGRAGGPYVIAVAVLFLLAAVVFPTILRPVERAWMALAGVLSLIMTYVILAITFFLVITPMGLILRMLGKDLLQKKFDSEKSSYWIPVESDGPCSRHDKPY